MHTHMTQFESIDGIGRATECVIAKEHRPKPLRFVWHHVLPIAAGGKTLGPNLVQLCDSCHYTVHILLYALAQGQVLHQNDGTVSQRGVAKAGYELAKAAGTINLIPRESDVVIE